MDVPANGGTSAGSGSIEATTSPHLAELERGQCLLSSLRLVGFLALHLIMIAASLFAMIFLFITHNRWMSVFLLVPFLVSGVLCTAAAWHSRTPLLGRTGLPLSKRSCLLQMFLAVPFGLFQGVIVILELEDFCARRRSMTSSGAGVRQRLFGGLRGDQSSLDKFHPKAVNGAFEGLATSAVVLFAYWGMGFPNCKLAILNTPEDWDTCIEQDFLKAMVCINFFSVGLCLMELDFAVSPRTRKRMRRSLRRLVWWWVPAALEWLVTFLMVDLYGGCEVSIVVRLICATPCVFANVFRFVDSPYKRRAARKLSKAFAYRTIIGTIALPALYFCNEHAIEDAKKLWNRHYISISIALVSHPMYWISFWCISYNPFSTHNEQKKDIFTACERGDMRAVMSLTSEATVGVDLNIFDIDGKTPLMLVVERCSPNVDCFTEAEMCRLLIEEGARVDLQVFDDQRPLWKCFQRAMRRRWTALHLAAWRGCAAVVDGLLEGERTYGPSFSSSSIGQRYIDRQGDTPMHIAARRGYVDIVQCLLKEFPSWVNVKNLRAKTPLDLAIGEEVRQVLQDTAASTGETPLLPATNSDPTQKLPASASPWVKLPICYNLSEDGPCRAPGLSSFVVSCGGGIVGKVFLTENVMPTIDESTVLMSPSLTLVLRSTDHIPGVVEPVATSNQTQSAANVLEASAIIKPPLLEDLEPVDKDGVVCPTWSRMTQGQPFGPFAFAYVEERYVLGEGSYGLVWRARDRSTGAKFAVKNIMVNRGRGTAQREYEMTNHLRLQPHPCIVTFFQAHCFPDKGFFMLVMELCPHGDLLEFITRARSEAKSMEAPYEPPALSPKWIGQVFLALEHLHVKMRSMLRDLKPDNVVVNEKGLAKLTDFGFGRFGAESNGTWSFGVPPGSPGYIAPEALLQQKYDLRVDLYSFGVVMWVLLTGGVTYDPRPRPPLGKRTSRSDFSAHANDWVYLQQCIQNPERHHATPLKAPARELVAKLTQRREADRPMHAEIRHYQYMQDLSLPEACVSKEVVDAWLAASVDGSMASSSSAPASSTSQRRHMLN